eukprot:SAG11_NODE_2636_length_3149_cov_1.681639_6_plen_326_part_00
MPPLGPASAAMLGHAAEALGAGQDAQHLHQPLKLLRKVLGNVIAQPEEPKFRSLKLSNKAVATHLVSCPNALAFLNAVGFEEVEGVLTLPPQIPLPHLEAALVALDATPRRFVAWRLGVDTPSDAVRATQHAHATLLLHGHVSRAIVLQQSATGLLRPVFTGSVTRLSWSSAQRRMARRSMRRELDCQVRGRGCTSARLLREAAAAASATAAASAPLGPTMRCSAVLAGPSAPSCCASAPVATCRPTRWHAAGKPTARRFFSPCARPTAGDAWSPGRCAAGALPSAPTKVLGARGCRRDPPVSAAAVVTPSPGSVGRLAPGAPGL